MRIVILDGFAMNPGDLAWDQFEKLGELTVYDRTDPGMVVQRVRGADVVMVNKVAIDAATMEVLPGLKYIGIFATGYNIVDVGAAKRRGIIVTNVPAYSTASAAQTAFALLLELTHHVGLHDRGVHGGKWTASLDFAYWEKPLVELDGLVMGIVGMGMIGEAVGRIARAFGMKVMAYSRTARDVAGVKFVDLETLFREADVLSLHCPLTDQTRGIVNAERLGWMKQSAFLINTSRGALVDEKALAAALNEERIAGTGLDVLSTEPPAAENPLLSAKNCVITPHIAWGTRAARMRLMNEAVQNLRAFMAGQPRNVVQ